MSRRGRETRGAIPEFAQGSNLSDFEQNRMLRRAVERELSAVSEAVSQATRHFPDLEASIGPARQIVGFRNRIVHEYAEVETEIIWVIQNEVPRLLEESDSRLKESGHGG